VEPRKRSNNVEKATLSGGYVIDFLLLQRTGEEKDILEAAIGETEKESHDVDVGCGC
jgi:hypothetical protein